MRSVLALLGALATISSVSSVSTGAQAPGPATATFTKDVAPILQRSCQNCHRPDTSRRCRC